MMSGQNTEIVKANESTLDAHYSDRNIIEVMKGMKTNIWQDDRRIKNQDYKLTPCIYVGVQANVEDGILFRR